MLNSQQRVHAWLPGPCSGDSGSEKPRKKSRRKCSAQQPPPAPNQGAAFALSTAAAALSEGNASALGGPGDGSDGQNAAQRERSTRAALQQTRILGQAEAEEALGLTARITPMQVGSSPPPKPRVNQWGICVRAQERSLAGWP